MTDADKRKAYLEWINEYTNQDFTDDDSLPFSIDLALEKLVDLDSSDEIGVESKSQGGKSISFASKDGIPANVMRLIEPFRKVTW